MFELSMTHAERGYGFYRERRIAEAVREFRLGEKAGEDPDVAALERWLSYMTAGEFELAWRESDRVLERRRLAGESCGHLPEHQRWLWDGSPLVGKRVRVRCFHGLGDTIQFVRFLPQLRAVCREVQFVPQMELRELMPAMGGGDVDFEMELMEVPHALRMTLDKIPAMVPYVSVPGSACERPTQIPCGLGVGFRRVAAGALNSVGEFSFSGRRSGSGTHRATARTCRAEPPTRGSHVRQSGLGERLRCRYRAYNPRARSCDHNRHDGGSSGWGAGGAGLDLAAVGFGLALAGGPRRFALVSHDAFVPRATPGRLGGGAAPRGAGASALSATDPTQSSRR